MFHHPDQLMALNSSHLHDLKTENDRWHLATKVIQAQQAAQQPNRLSFLYSLVSQFFTKPARPTRTMAVELR